jgi:hypothetical protein
MLKVGCKQKGRTFDVRPFRKSKTAILQQQLQSELQLSRRA